VTGSATSNSYNFTSKDWRRKQVKKGVFFPPRHCAVNEVHDWLFPPLTAASSQVLRQGKSEGSGEGVRRQRKRHQKESLTMTVPEISGSCVESWVMLV